MKIFRKLRVSSILDHKVSKYLLYAVGEILLVIIGILIAVSINNANEKRKLRSELQLIYQAVENDLVRDTVVLTDMIIQQDYLDSLTHAYLYFERVNPDTINELNVADCIHCGALHALYSKFTPSEGGVASLVDFESRSDLKQDSLSYRIFDLYASNNKSFEDISDQIASTAVENLKSLEKYDWYSDFGKGEFNKDQVNYFLTSREYENKLTTFYLLQAGNLSRLLKDYKAESVALIKEIERRKK